MQMFTAQAHTPGRLIPVALLTAALTACGGGAGTSSTTTATAPGAPTIGAATAGNASASIAFSAPSSNGGSAITGYTATCTATGSTLTGSGTSSPITVSGMTNGSGYTCSVTASNAVGTSAASGTVTVTPSASSGDILAKYSSLNTAVGSSTSATAVALSGTGTANSTAAVGCAVSGTGSTVTGLVNANNTSNISSNVTTNYSYSWTCSSSARSLTANGIPNHAVGVFPNSGNPNTIRTQSVSVATITLTPSKASSANYNVQPTGYGLNGIKFDANTGGGCPDSAAGTGSCTLLGGGAWSLEALVAVTPFDFGADSNLAHVQPTGDYHYHGAPERLFTALGGEIDSSTAVAKKMVLIGWAMDGYPIYFKYGYRTASDATSGLVALRGNYKPNATATTLSTRPSVSVFPLGTFKNDWAYSSSNGGDLDECNGRTGVTPEFPGGIYYYVVTDTYPYAPRCISGNV
ncbi:YHYH protein [Roseateles sp. SL47]|uniref:YHYH protein n=1 Tax=Roseateles sp. SL47 TaxID=2995138 RepID=UPI00226EE260|nr:YHYH protein [Roseateles sp. SL47]WAC71685.1 YHYH protein [Roseateles sp. SL47]